MRRVLYVAHPLTPTLEECEAVPNFPGFGGKRHDFERARRALRANIDLAMRWLAWLRASFPGDTFIAPWIATVMSLRCDDSPELREAGLRDDCAVVERCDGIVLCGSRVSSGMQREREHGAMHAHGIWCASMNGWDAWDLTVLGLREPPAVVVGMTLDAWLEVQSSADWIADAGPLG